MLCDALEAGILHEAESKLSKSSHHFSKSVRCDYSDGVLRIHGKVPSFYLKQTAQSLIKGIDGVDRIDNELVVINPTGISSEPAV